jgi:hypothetical protein
MIKVSNAIVQYDSATLLAFEKFIPYESKKHWDLLNIQVDSPKLTIDVEFFHKIKNYINIRLIQFSKMYCSLLLDYSKEGCTILHIVEGPFHLLEDFDITKKSILNSMYIDYKYAKKLNISDELKSFIHKYPDLNELIDNHLKRN